jgi:hypothetical protein
VRAAQGAFARVPVWAVPPLCPVPTAVVMIPMCRSTLRTTWFSHPATYIIAPSSETHRPLGPVSPSAPSEPNLAAIAGPPFEHSIPFAQRDVDPARAGNLDRTGLFEWRPGQRSFVRCASGLPVSGEGCNDAGAGIDAADAMIEHVAHVQVVCGIDGNAVGLIKLRFAGRTTVAPRSRGSSARRRRW